MIRAFFRNLFGRARERQPPQRKDQVLHVDPTPDRPVPFGYKTCWLAVRGEDASAIADLLGLQDLRQANWVSGLENMHQKPVSASSCTVFITPPAQGWTLIATGLGLCADNEAHVAQVVALLERLSRCFGEAQYFGSYRVVGYVAWFRARDGELQRAFAEADGMHFINNGPVSEAEFALGFPDVSGTACEDLWQILEPAMEEDESFFPADEENPLLVARDWSVAPSDLPDLLGDGLSSGWIGVFSIGFGQED